MENAGTTIAISIGAIWLVLAQPRQLQECVKQGPFRARCRAPQTGATKDGAV